MSGDVQRGQRRADHLAAWIASEVERRGGRGAVVALSGGIDSAVVAGLVRKAFPQRERVLGLILPCHSLPADAEDAMLVAKTFDLSTLRVDLSSVYDQLTQTLGNVAELRSVSANLKPRLRMIVAYAHATANQFLVMGTGNRSELEMGYFTKYGDGGVDLLPIGALTKGEVREVAIALGVPQRVIDKPPSAGLWEGQTDEGEMGFTYQALDDYLLTGKAQPELREKLEARQGASQHKRSLAPIAPADPV